MFKVMLATGTLCHQMTDFDIDGAIPCRFGRIYRSSTLSSGPLGVGWHWPWDITLTLNGRELIQRSVGELVAERFPLDENVNGSISSKTGATVSLNRARILVSLATGWIYQFPLPIDLDHPVRIEAIRDLRGHAVRAINRHGHLEELTDVEGRQYVIRRDKEHRVLGIDLVRGGAPGLPTRLVTYEYDANGDLVRVTDRNGAHAEYEYDTHLLVAYRNRVGGWYYAEYDSERRCIQTGRSDGRGQRTYDYDPARGHVLVRDALGHGTLHRFDEHGRLVEVVPPSGLATMMVYDANGGLLGVIDSSGRSSTISVQRTDETREVRMTDADGCEQRVTTSPHDRTEVMTDCAGATWTRWYDEVGNLTAMTTPLGATYRFEYDTDGKVTRAILPTGNVVRYSFTPDNGHVDVIDSLGVVGSLTWDAEHRLVRKTLGEDNPEEYRYDGLGRIREIIRPNGASVRFVADAEGHCVAVTNEAGETTRLEWSLFGELLAGVDALGGRFRNHYDAALRRAALTNASDERVEFEYDSMDRPIRQRFFDGTEERYRYGTNGSVVAIAYSDGSTVSLEYDLAGRPVAMTSDDHAVRFEYDPRGHPIATDRDGVVVSYEYDAEGRSIVEMQDGVEIRRAYDVAGNCVSMAVAELGVRRFHYDVRQRLITVEDFNGDRIDLTYDVRDRCTTVSIANRVWLAHEYSAGNLLDRVRLETAFDSWEVRYAYDPAGRVIRRYGPASDDRAFEYDPGGHLARVIDTAGIRHFPFTETGDPLRDAADNGITYGAGGRIHNAGARRFVFDGRGRVVTVTEPGRQLQLTYDHLNWLTRVDSGSTVTEYRYDALGRRVRKSSSSAGETRFVWDGEWLLGELGSDSEGDRTYLGSAWRVWGYSAPAVPGQTSLVLTDINGHPLVVAGVAGSTRLGTRDPWGAYGPHSTPVNAVVSTRFAGQYEDPESGFFYNRYRYYDPLSRRYLTPDPIRLAGSVNPYLYQVDPINNIDPDGLATVTASQCLPGTPAPKTAPPSIPDDPGCSRGSSIHNDCITKTRNRANSSYTTRADQSMEYGTGNNRPDLRMSHPSGQRVYVEWDNPPATRAAGHRNDICANDPGAIVILVTLTSRYGAPGGPTPNPTAAGTRSPKAQMGKGAGLSDSDCGIDDINTTLAASGLPTI